MDGVSGCGSRRDLVAGDSEFTICSERDVVRIGVEVIVVIVIVVKAEGGLVTSKCP